MKTLEEALAELETANAKIATLESDVSEWKGHSRNHENAKKALEKEQANLIKTAVAEATANSEKELKTFRTATIATKYNIPEALYSRISGGTTEELEADAKAFATGAGFWKEGETVETTTTPGKPGNEESGKVVKDAAEFAAQASTFKPIPEQGAGDAPQAPSKGGAKTMDEFLAAAQTIKI